MKTKNSIKAFLFLFIILFSFSVSAYNSIHQASNTDRSVKNVHLNVPPNNNLTVDNIIFKELENENDTEDFLNESFFILPFSTVASRYLQGKILSSSLDYHSKAVAPVFISIRSIRI